MTSKRSSRVIEDERTPREPTQQAAMASIATSRGNSCSSLRDDLMSAAKDREDEKRAELSVREAPTVARYANGISVGHDVSTKVKKANGERVTGATSIAIPALGLHPAYPSPPDHDRIANFGVVLPGVYRSSYPLLDQFNFYHALGLKTVITLSNKQDERSVNLNAFVQGHGIRHVMFDMQGTKKEDIPRHTMQAILGIVLDKSCYPLLIHCNQGKHRTGCVVAAARKVSGWPVETVLEEYRSFAEPKVRECDVEYIGALEASSLQISIRDIGAPLWGSSGRFTPAKQRTFLRMLSLATFVMLATLIMYTTIQVNVGTPLGP